MKLGVLVTHPGRQHSHQAALALAARGLLAGYWSGVPSVDAQFDRIPRALRSHVARYFPVPLPPESTRWFPATPAIRQLSQRVLPGRWAQTADYVACRLFDRWAANGLRRIRTSAVVACEISALQTFRIARDLGLKTILDAPAFHHTAEERLHGFSETPRLRRRIVETKDREIELADHIVCVSSLARDSYVAAGVPPEKVHAVAVGADTSLFRERSQDGRPTGDKFVFLFVGAPTFRKGVDVLLRAFESFRAADVCLRLVGPGAPESSFLRAAVDARIEVLPALDQASLAAHYEAADVLVIPSRADSFGMVVPEALACGLPAIVSDMVGAKDLIAEGKTGWVVPAGDVDSLRSRMAECVRERDVLRSMAAECRRVAETADWSVYHRRLADLFESEILRRG